MQTQDMKKNIWGKARRWGFLLATAGQVALLAINTHLNQRANRQMDDAIRILRKATELSKACGENKAATASYMKGQY